MREKGMNDVQIANWLNDNGHPTPIGNTFKNAHVHSIAKKRKRRLEILDRKPTLSISNINFRYKKNGQKKYGYYLNIFNQSYIDVMKTIYFIMNYFIQLSCMLLGWNTVNEFYLKPVKVKSKDRPHR